MAVTILDNGRIDGLRITVYDVDYYQRAGRDAATIASILGLTSAQVAAAAHYIQEHRAKVDEVSRRVAERIAHGNAAQIEEKRQASRAKMEAWLAQHRNGDLAESNVEGHPGGQ